MANDSKYLICRDVADAKAKIDNLGIDSDIVLGVKQTSHITVGEFALTKDGDIIVEIPKTLLEYQDKIEKSNIKDSFKTVAETLQLKPLSTIGETLPKGDKL